MHMPPVPPETNRNNPPVHPHQPPYYGEEQPAFEEQVQQPGPFMDQADPSMEPGEEQEVQQTASPVLRMMVVVLAILGVMILLRVFVFTIRNIHISGLNAMTQEQAVAPSGLNRGLFFFTLKEDTVKESINKNRYLQYLGMEKVFPNGLSIRVLERRQFAFFTHLGVGYVLSQDGMILEQTRDLKTGADLILVNGLSVWGQQSPGAYPASTDPSQTESLIRLFEELIAWGFDSQIASIDIAQSLNISMQTKDGYTINLGAEEHLHAKVGTVYSVVNELRRRQMTGGIIEATLPGEATYQAGR